MTGGYREFIECNLNKLTQSFIRSDSRIGKEYGQTTECKKVKYHYGSFSKTIQIKYLDTSKPCEQVKGKRKKHDFQIRS